LHTRGVDVAHEVFVLASHGAIRRGVGHGGSVQRGVSAEF
jgi:hypothetical protein